MNVDEHQVSGEAFSRHRGHLPRDGDGERRATAAAPQVAEGLVSPEDPPQSQARARAATFEMDGNRSKPWLFMDLDGVVCPVPSQSRKAHIRRNGPPAGYKTWPGAIYDMYVDERMIGWARQLDRAYDVVWCSAWGELLLPVVAEPLGLDHWPVLPVPLLTDDAEAGSGPLSLKAKAIAEHLAVDPRPFAWCDDYLYRASFPEALRSLRLPHLLVRPGARVGLTARHVERLLEFARQHAGRLTPRLRQQHGWTVAHRDAATRVGNRYTFRSAGSSRTQRLYDGRGSA